METPRHIRQLVVGQIEQGEAAEVSEARRRDVRQFVTRYIQMSQQLQAGDAVGGQGLEGVVS